ncbi:hypothetical protein R1sor_023527 [Riccia sorocarpa]|uniref:Clustered mitochondria protein homolog n=1 Tax=Riccia sorocarpa TaxID=122646 RepID=A0ABD3GPF8_9MARC
MAGKSNKSKGKSKNGGTSKAIDLAAGAVGLSAGNPETSDTEAKPSQNPEESPKTNAASHGTTDSNEESTTAKEAENSETKDGDEAGLDGEDELRLYPMTVKGPSGEQMELQVNPGDSVMDLRQFLLDAPETCFYTCYDLILNAADGMRYHLAEYLEIGEVADVAAGGCTLEMVNALYDDRSVRSHVRRTRDLISTANLHSSLSTALATEYEEKQAATGQREEGEASSSASEGKAKNVPDKEAGSPKSEAPELEGLGFMDDTTGLLAALVSSPQELESNCVESIAFSSLNPVPGYRRLQGDLLYLDIVTAEGHSYCVTAHTQGFFVNQSKGNVLDPRSAKNSAQSATLVGLLRLVSDKFTKGFAEVLERKAAGHPFENVPVLLPPNPWLGVYPPPVHKRDIARAEDSLMVPYGTEVIGMQRDWNEELQSCREFPRENLQDRIMRDRALYKVNCDFVDAATKGAKAVIGRCIPPINPTDPDRFHMYVHNNIFFSFAVDGDFASMQQLREQELQQQQADGVPKASEDDNDATKAASDENTKTVVETAVDAPAEVANTKTVVETAVDEAPAEVAEVVSEAAEVSSGPSDEAKKDEATSSAVEVTEEVKDGNAAATPVIESEQATYASSNNDLKGTKAYNSTDVAGLYTLAMAIVDYRGHRVVAQSIIPGILQGDKTDSLLYGSVDNGKKISWNEKFHAKVLEAGKLLHIKEHEVYDGSGNTVKLCAPVECKGIVGSDDRHYMLDLMRTTPRDANYTGLGSRLCVLRPELIAAFCQVEALERAKKRKSDGEEADEKVLLQEELPNVVLNPNVFTDFKVAGTPEEVAADEELVSKAAKYLVDTVLPKLVQDLSSLEVSPMDGHTLTEALHAHGINVRYLGQVAKLAKHLPHVWDLCVVEMIVRAAKHVLKGVLRETLDQDVGGAIAHFFNCLVGDETLSTPDTETTTEASPVKQAEEVGDAKPPESNGKVNRKKKNKIKGTSAQNSESDKSKTESQEKKPESRPSYLCITAKLVWIDIRECVKFKYQFELPEDARSKICKVSTFRDLCQKVGVMLAARDYNFSSKAPFQITDILDLQAVVKHSTPVCADARDLLENGKLRLAQGKLNEAYELFSEAFTILQQVCGPMHREVANCCRYLAMVLYHAGDMAGAIMQQHKELIINERCLGPDHPDTAHSYGNMALFYHGLNQTELALRHMARTLLLLNVSCGSDHPDVAATFINIAMMYQDIGRMHVALRYLQEALKRNERLLGPDHIQTAVCYHALAIAFNCMGAYKLSLQHERSTYNILLKQLGEEDSRTRDSANWIKTFQIRDLQAHAHKQRGQQTQSVLAAAKAAEQLKARSDLVQAFQAAAGPGGRGAISKAAAAAALLGDGLPRPRGMDERAARAAAEVRKKAVARGLNVRPQSSPQVGQGMPPLGDLLSLINSGKVTPQAKSALGTSSGKGSSSSGKGASGVTEGKKTSSDTGKSNVESTAEANGSVEATEKVAPVGLGVGLGGLESKKRKPRTKNP